MPDDMPSEGAGIGAVTAQLLGLGRDTDALRRVVDRQRAKLGTLDDRLADVEARVASLARTLADLSDQLAELAVDEREPSPHSSWFETTDAAHARTRLTDLTTWLDRVYLQFPDAALPSCWLWHPAIVEELLWLRRSWIEAFTGRTAAAFRIADWHDRQRPGVVARIRALNDGVCSIDQHVPGAEQDRRTPTAQATAAVPAIADWWASSREEAPPYPTRNQLAEAAERRR